MWLFVHNLDNIETNSQNDEQHGDVDDQQVGVDVLIDDAQEENDMLHHDNRGDTPKLPEVPTRRSNMVIKSSCKYHSHEYVTLTIKNLSVLKKL